MIDQDADYLKEGVRVLSQALMEVEQRVDAARHERTAGRTGQRNGYRERSWNSRVGTVKLKVPRVRDGGCFPSLLEPQRKVESIGSSGFAWVRIFPADLHFSEVEPRGFEPLTSAVQSQVHRFTCVHYGPLTRLSRRFLRSTYSRELSST